MIQHYCKIAFRNILKYKTQSIISIIGLAVGNLLALHSQMLWIHYEITYDKFYEGLEQNSFAFIKKPLLVNQHSAHTVHIC